MMNQAEVVRQLIKKHFWDMAEGTSLSTGNEPVLPEDAADFFEEYFKILDVDPAGFDFRQYFPNEGIRFFAQCNPSPLPEDRASPPTTVNRTYADCISRSRTLVVLNRFPGAGNGPFFHNVQPVGIVIRQLQFLLTHLFEI